MADEKNNDNDQETKEFFTFFEDPNNYTDQQLITNMKNTAEVLGYTHDFFKYLTVRPFPTNSCTSPPMLTTEICININGSAWQTLKKGKLSRNSFMFTYWRGILSEHRGSFHMRNRYSDKFDKDEQNRAILDSWVASMAGTLQVDDK